MKHNIFDNEIRKNIQSKAGWITDLTKIAKNHSDDTFFYSIMKIRVQNGLFVNRNIVGRELLYMFDKMSKKMLNNTSNVNLITTTAMYLC